MNVTMQMTVATASPLEDRRRPHQDNDDGDEYPSDEERGFGAKPHLTDDEDDASDGVPSPSLLPPTPPPPSATRKTITTTKQKDGRSFAFLANVGVSPTASTSGSIRTFTSGSSSTDDDDDTFADMSRATTQDHYLTGGSNKEAALCLALLCSGAAEGPSGMTGVSGPMISLLDSDSTKSLFDDEEGDEDDNEGDDEGETDDEDDEDFESSFSS